MRVGAENPKSGMSDAKTAVGASPSDLPRVLVLSDEVPQTVNAGAILLYRLFAGYGQDAQGERGQPEPVHCERGHCNILKKEHVTKLFVVGPKAHANAALLNCSYRELRMPLRRLETSRFSMHKRSLQALGLIPLPSHRKVLRLLGSFRPEVIVCVMQNTPFMCLAERTARRLGVPLVLIVHDLNEEFEKVYPWAKKALFATNCRVYRSAARRLCVSPEMAEYLEKRYGVPGEVMYPNRSEELQTRAAELSLTLRAAADQKTKRPKDQKTENIPNTESLGATDSLPATSNPLQASAALTLGYAGSLAYGYGEELVKLIDVLREVGARIRMFSPKPSGILDALNHATDVVEICGYRPALEAWGEIQQTCDAVILPYSNPAGKYESLYRTHFPSKLTEYLALGMPVIVSGPEFATGVKWAQGADQEVRGEEPEFEKDYVDVVKIAPNGAVPCVSREELVSLLNALKHDGALRSEAAKRAVSAGARNFDPARIRKAYWATLKEVAA
jgi:glycosyltransferase involved in cell wall biosynthesis